MSGLLVGARRQVLWLGGQHNAPRAAQGSCCVVCVRARVSASVGDQLRVLGEAGTLHAMPCLARSSGRMLQVQPACPSCATAPISCALRVGAPRTEAAAAAAAVRMQVVVDLQSVVKELLINYYRENNKVRAQVGMRASGMCWGSAAFCGGLWGRGCARTAPQGRRDLPS